jgi:hypothetical protein
VTPNNKNNKSVKEMSSAALLDFVTDKYSDLEVKWSVRDQSGWWLGVTLANRGGFKTDLLELKRLYPTELQAVLNERLVLYQMDGYHGPMKAPERALREILALDDKTDLSISPLTKRQKEEVTASLLEHMKNLIMDEYALFCALEFDLEKACDDCDDDNGERYRKGKALMELMDRYAEKAGAYPDSTIMAIRASLPSRV